MSVKVRRLEESNSFILSLVGAVFIGPMALAIFMPALPAIRAQFDIDLQSAQMSLTLPLLTILFAPLIVGRLVDLVGRRPSMLLNYAMVVAGCLICIHAQHYWFFVVGRTLVAVFSSGCLIVARAAIHDIYAGPHLAQIMARFSVPPVLAILLSPVLGGLIIDYYQWYAIFWLIFVLSLILMVLSWRSLPETRRVVESGNKKADQELSQVFRSRVLWCYTGQSSFHFGIAFSFASIAPYIMVNQLGSSVTGYAFGLLTVVAALLAGILVSEQLSKQTSIPRMVFQACTIGAVLSISSTLVVVTVPLVLSVYSLFVPALLIAFAIGLAMPSSQAGIVSAVDNQAGTASGISTASQMLFAAVFTHLAAIPWENIQLSLGLLSVTAMGGAWLFSIFAVKFQAQKLA